MQAAVIHRDMMPDADDAPLGHAQWSDIQFTSTLKTPTERSWRLPAAVLVAGLHILGLSWLADIRVERVMAPVVPLQISFITRPKPELEPLPPRRPEKPIASQAPRRLPPAPIDSVIINEPTEPTPEATDAPLRLNLTTDSWTGSAATPHPHTSLQRPVDRLPGRSKAFVEGVQLSEQITPEKMVKAVGAFLFGGRDPDPCGQSRQRLANSSRQDAASIERDLRRMERYCRP